MSTLLDWFTAGGVVIAAVASVVAMWQSRPAVTWMPVNDDGGRKYRLTNAGQRPARDVRLRVGSMSDPTDQDQAKSAAVVRPGEGLVCFDQATFGGPADYAFNLTWREGWLQRRRSWSYRLY